MNSLFPGVIVIDRGSVHPIDKLVQDYWNKACDERQEFFEITACQLEN